MKVFQMKKYESMSMKVYQISPQINKKAKLSFLEAFSKDLFRNFTNSHFCLFYGTLHFLAHLYITISDRGGSREL